MPRGRASNDPEILLMALKGYEQEILKIQEKIREIQAQLGDRKMVVAGAAEEKPAAKRRLSAAARKRIAAAQKRRWAEHRRRAALAAKGQ